MIPIEKDGRITHVPESPENYVTRTCLGCGHDYQLCICIPKINKQEQENRLDNQQPSICRNVIYNHPGSADGKFKPLQSPAIVQKVNDDNTVELVVFSVYGGMFFNHNVSQGDGSGQWNWPPRV